MYAKLCKVLTVNALCGKRKFFKCSDTFLRMLLTADLVKVTITSCFWRCSWNLEIEIAAATAIPVDLPAPGTAATASSPPSQSAIVC